MAFVDTLLTNVTSWSHESWVFRLWACYAGDFFVGVSFDLTGDSVDHNTHVLIKESVSSESEGLTSTCESCGGTDFMDRGKETSCVAIGSVPRAMSGGGLRSVVTCSSEAS
jgi:hypothetical protein